MVTLCGFWLTRKLVTPLLQVDKRMQDIAAGEETSTPASTCNGMTR